MFPYDVRCLGAIARRSQRRLSRIAKGSSDPLLFTTSARADSQRRWLPPRPTQNLEGDGRSLRSGAGHVWRGGCCRHAGSGRTLPRDAAGSVRSIFEASPRRHILDRTANALTGRKSPRQILCIAPVRSFGSFRCTFLQASCRAWSRCSSNRASGDGLGGGFPHAFGFH